MCQGKKALATETVAEGGGGKGREWHRVACLLQNHLKRPSNQRGVLRGPIPAGSRDLKIALRIGGEATGHRPS
jgi:hypothetical protein